MTLNSEGAVAQIHFSPFLSFLPCLPSLLLLSLFLPSSLPLSPFPSFPISFPLSLVPFPLTILPSPLYRRRPHLNAAMWSVERCKLSQWGLGRSPSRNRIWCIFTALHEVQTRSCDEISVCRLSNACIVTKLKKNLTRFLYHAKDHSV